MGHSRRFGDVGDSSAMPPLATKSLHCSKCRERPGQQREKRSGRFQIGLPSLLGHILVKNLIDRETVSTHLRSSLTTLATDARFAADFFSVRIRFIRSSSSVSFSLRAFFPSMPLLTTFSTSVRLLQSTTSSPARWLLADASGDYRPESIRLQSAASSHRRCAARNASRLALVPGDRQRQKHPEPSCHRRETVSWSGPG